MENNLELIKNDYPHRLERRGWTIGVMAFVILILLLFLAYAGNRINVLEAKNASLQKQVSEINSLKNEISKLKIENAFLKGKLEEKSSDLTETLFVLESCINKSSNVRKELCALTNEVRGMKEEISSLRNSFDSLKAGMVVNISKVDTTYSTETKSDLIIQQNLSVKAEKISFIKKGKRMSTPEKLVDNSLPISIIAGKGFDKKTSEIFIYNYKNENNEEVDLYLISEFENEKVVNQLINKNNGEVLLEKTSYFCAGAGGLLYEKTVDLNLPINERKEDFQKRRRGCWEIGVGSLLTAAGGVGTWYLTENPEINLNIRQNGKTVYTFNAGGMVKGASITAVVFGALEMVFGFWDISTWITTSNSQIVIPIKIK